MNVREPCTILDISDELRLRIFRYADPDEKFLCVNREFLRIGTSVLAERIANDHSDLTIAVALNSLHSCSRHFNTQDAALRLCYRVRKRIIQEIDNSAFYDAVRILNKLQGLFQVTEVSPTFFLPVARGIQVQVAAHLDTEKFVDANDALRVLAHLPIPDFELPKDLLSTITETIRTRLIKDMREKHHARVSNALSMLSQLPRSTILSESPNSDVSQPMCDLILEQLHAGKLRVAATMLSRLESLHDFGMTEKHFLRIGKSVRNQVFEGFADPNCERHLLQGLLHLLQHPSLHRSSFDDILSTGRQQITQCRLSLRCNWAQVTRILGVLHRLPIDTKIPGDLFAQVARPFCIWLSARIRQEHLRVDTLSETLYHMSNIAEFPEADVECVVEAILAVALKLINTEKSDVATSRLYLLKHLRLRSEIRQRLFSQLLKPCQIWMINEIGLARDGIKTVLEVLQYLSAHIEPHPDILSELCASHFSVDDSSIMPILQQLPDDMKLQIDCSVFVSAIWTDLRDAVRTMRFPYVETLLRGFSRLSPDLNNGVHCNLDIVTPCLYQVVQNISDDKLGSAIRNLGVLNHLSIMSTEDQNMVSYVLEMLEVRIEGREASSRFRDSCLYSEYEHIEKVFVLWHKLQHKRPKSFLYCFRDFGSE